MVAVTPWMLVDDGVMTDEAIERFDEIVVLLVDDGVMVVLQT
jgi:hypothetical protein